MAKQSEASLLLRIKTTGEEALEATADSLASIGKVATAAYAVVGTAVAASISAYKESEEVVNSLNQTLINNGIYSKQLSNDYQDMATALQKKSTFADEDIIKAQSQMQSYLGQTKITQELMKATLDFAAAKKIDLASAADIVGKSITTETNALGRQGIALTEGASATKKMEEAVQGLNSRFGGQAEAATKGLGALDQMKVAMSDILEVVGKELAPFVTAVAKSMTQFAIKIQENRSLLDGFVKTVQFMAKVGVVAKNVVIGLSEVISGQLGSAVGAASQAMQGHFGQAWETIKSNFHASSQQVTDRTKQMFDEIDAVNVAFQEKSRADAEMEIALLQANSDRKKQIKSAETAHIQAELAKDTANVMQMNKLKEDADIARINRQIANEQNASTKLALEYEKRRLVEAKLKEQSDKDAIAQNALNKILTDQRTNDFEKGLSAMVQLQNSKSQELKAIGKGAAIAQIAIDTARGAMAAYAGVMAALAWIPVVGPIIAVPAAIAAAGAVVAYGVERTASVAAMAEGGIVRATPGGIPAIIGEGGRDEAVIPLENGTVPGMGNQINITVYGGLLGDESQAKMFAITIDRELLKLRQSNESLAFDEGII